MDIITALAVSISLLGGLATWLFLGPVLGGLGLSIWAAFVAWACFFHCGGLTAGLQKTIIHNIFGAIMGWIALLLVTHGLGGALGVPLGAAVAIVITVFILVIAAKNPMLSDIPASVLGFASVAAFALAGKGEGLGNVTAGDLSNPLLNVVISMAIGAIFGFVSQKIAGAISSDS